MAKSNNVTKTFVGEAHVSTKKKGIKTSPSYFWSNIDGIATDGTNMIQMSLFHSENLYSNHWL